MKAKGGVAKKKAKETTSKGPCFHYHKDGHWRINYKAYLESLKKEAFDVPSILGTFVIEISIVSNNNLWLLDTCCGYHICTNV